VIYLIRHGETEWNRQRRHQGHANSPLTPKGVTQAHALGRLLHSLIGQSPDVDVVSSPLGRALHTAAVICQELALPQDSIKATQLLIEHDMGKWQALTPADIDRLYPGERKARDADKWNYRIPGGESYALLYQRSRRWLDTLSVDRTIVAVTHEMISRTIRAAYAGLSPQATLSMSHSQDCIYLLTDGRIIERRTPAPTHTVAI
jgi:probable phosphoglycerate mutase